MGIDNLERSVSLVVGGIAMVLALIISPHLFKDTLVTVTTKPGVAKACPPGYHLAHLICKSTLLTHWSYWLPQFLLIVVAGLLIVLFALLRKRAGVAVVCLLLGLAIGVTGLPFLLVGGWLVIRALRLQKYGDATFAGSSRRARDMAQTKKQGRRSTQITKDSTATFVPTPAAPSKRYTPKQRPRRR